MPTHRESLPSHLLLQFVGATTRRSLLASTIGITCYVDRAPTLTTADAALSTSGTSFGGGTVQNVVVTTSGCDVVATSTPAPAPAPVPGGAQILRTGAATTLAAGLLLLILMA